MMRSSKAVQAFKGYGTVWLTAGVLATLCCSPVEAAQRLEGHIPAAGAQARAVGRMPRASQLNLAIGLPLLNHDTLNRLLGEVADPESQNYHRYLTPEQFAEQFGPTEEDYNTLIAFTESHGLTVTGIHPNRMLLDVAGSVAEVEKTFHIGMLIYYHPSRGEFFAADQKPTIDLDVKTLDIAGLDNFTLPQPMALKTKSLGQAKAYVTGSGPGGLFLEKDFRAAYAPGVTLDGSGQTVGLLEFDGFFASDLRANFAKAGLPPVTTSNGFGEWGKRRAGIGQCRSNRGDSVR